MPREWLLFLVRDSDSPSVAFGLLDMVGVPQIGGRGRKMFNAL